MLSVSSHQNANVNHPKASEASRIASLPHPPGPEPCSVSAIIVSENTT